MLFASFNHFLNFRDLSFSAGCLKNNPDFQNELIDDLKISNQTAFKYKYPGQIWTAVSFSFIFKRKCPLYAFIVMKQ